MARNRRSAEPATTEEPTVPGVPPAETPAETPSEEQPIVVDVGPTPEEVAAAAEESARAAEAERVRLEEEARIRAEQEAATIIAAEEEATRVAQRQVIDTCKGVLENYFQNVRRAAREDAVEWLGRMHEISESVAEQAFDEVVAGSAFSKETVKRSKTIEVDVEEFFLRSPRA